MAGFDASAAARWIAEAVETGNALSALPAEIAPPDITAAAEVAAAVLDALEIPPCGLRLLHRTGAATLAGPMIEGRLIPSGAEVALRSLRHPVVTGALVGVLAEALDPASTTPPVLARLHPALDISATRFGDPPEDARLLTADLARLGLVIVGRGKAVPAGTLRAALAPKGTRRRGQEIDLASAFLEAATAARAWGGLPAGALLVVAGLTAPEAPTEPGTGTPTVTLRASFGVLGAAEVRFS